MGWYKQGVVSVTQNSNAVIGAGTAFIANSRVGDGFRGPDGRWYEVTNIASNTALSISPDYEGPTAAGGFYSIMPVQGYQKDLSDKVREILNEYGETLAALGTTGNYDILPVAKGGTGAVNASDALTQLGFSDFTRAFVDDADADTARATLVAAKSGSNNDITALSALATALSVAQGGTGGNTPALARSGLGLGSAAVAAILGAVSQSGGAPTGALMEYTSNSAGEAWKFANGLMVCVTTSVRTITLGTAFGAMFYPGAASSGPTTPATFVGTPYNSLVISGGGNLSVSAPTGAIPAGSYQNFYHMAPISSPAASFTYSYLAIGRWY